MLYIVGLGPGNPDRVPRPVLSLLGGGLPIYVRTARHPALDGEPLQSLLAGRDVTALDDEYETGASFEDTYAAIAERVLRAHQTHGDLVYAVPGHPLVGESTVARLLAEAKTRGVSVSVVGAPSFVDACLEALGEAITGDLHVVDALTLDPSDAAPPAVLQTGEPLLLYQVHSREAASQAKLALMQAGYPDEFGVCVVQGASVPGLESVRDVPLFELDRGVCDHLTTVWIPGLPSELRRPGFTGLLRVMARLRAPNNGCPWDLEQTHQSLRRYVIEEAYEVAQAIDDGDPDELCEELGDLLLQVVFHAQIAREDGVFDVNDVCAAIVEKLIRRHPHIFGTTAVSGSDEVLANWNAIKANEKGKETRISILDGVSQSLPALLGALEASKRVVKVGFEWPDTRGVLDKVEEEFRELRAEIEAYDASGQTGDKTRLASELGDVLFTLVNVSRKLGINPEDALRTQITRFGNRFRHIETRAREQNRALDTLPLVEMETYWSEAKAREKHGP